ncbi:hypothetical protein [Caballeronia sp. LZ032]|uniref:hypothetical protein n=1 Tax=Caballeronia sp. LZ032 TaxID=3038565 RepID=UPI00285C70EA|nr:hypothetical protein [Caballeronia sp. LZ032]MDR5879037.1 hypothetical protein [Caballeronia sp. LZ032]
MRPKTFAQAQVSFFYLLRKDGTVYDGPYLSKGPATSRLKSLQRSYDWAKQMRPNEEPKCSQASAFDLVEVVYDRRPNCLVHKFKG